MVANYELIRPVVSGVPFATELITLASDGWKEAMKTRFYLYEVSY